MLRQSGLEHQDWESAAKCSCKCWNFFDESLAGSFRGMTPYEAKFGCKITTPHQTTIQLPFSREVQCLPTNKSITNLLKKFGPKTCTGISMGYHAKSGLAWAESYYVPDVERFHRPIGCRTGSMWKEAYDHREIRICR